MSSTFVRYPLDRDQPVRAGSRTSPSLACRHRLRRWCRRRRSLSPRHRDRPQVLLSPPPAARRCTPTSASSLLQSFSSSLLSILSSLASRRVAGCGCMALAPCPIVPAGRLCRCLCWPSDLRIMHGRKPPGLGFQFFGQSGPFGSVGLGLDQGLDQVWTRSGPVGVAREKLFLNCSSVAL